MIGIFRRVETSIYDEPITKVLTGMETYGPEDPEFDTLMGHLERLSKMKAEKRRNPISLDTVAIVTANLAGILIIVAYEQKHVIRTAATGFLLRAK
jgi:hypothetical protein